MAIWSLRLAWGTKMQADPKWLRFNGCKPSIPGGHCMDSHLSPIHRFPTRYCSHRCYYWFHGFDPGPRIREKVVLRI